MADELLNQTSQELASSNQETESQKRIRQLSEKVRLTSEERDEKDRILQESTAKIATLEKENAFNSGFVDVLANYSAAKDHKDDIKAKVLSGMSVEDATFAVLGKAGKLGQAAPIAQAPQSPAGGSAPNAIQRDAQKSVSEMSREERKAALMEHQGEIANLLAPSMNL